MQKRSGSESVRGVLDPTLPEDLGALSQRERIVGAMIASCAEKSYAATTISDVVSRASISRTTFYKRFPDKRACFEAAIDHCLELLQDAAAESHSEQDAPSRAVRRATAAVLGLLASRPDVAQVLVAESLSVDPAVVERYRALVLPAVEALWLRVGETPPGRRADPRLAIGRIQVLILDQMTSGGAAELPELLPEVVYLLLLPFAGHDEALRQSRLASESSDTSVPQGDG
jgi:AcrR family transcriptional regulator